MRTTITKLDTSAFNVSKIRPKSNLEYHPLAWKPGFDSTAPSVSSLKMLDKHTRSIIENSHVISSPEVQRLLFLDHIHIPHALGEKTNEETIFIKGHSLSELKSTHYIMNKPLGVSTHGEDSNVNSLLPLPSLYFGYITRMERSCSGLILLLNDIRFKHIFEQLRPIREYTVSMTGKLSPQEFASVHSEFPFVKMELINEGNLYSLKTRICWPNLVPKIFASIGKTVSHYSLVRIGALCLPDTPHQRISTNWLLEQIGYY